ncbi:hypothetical protein ASPZODRAFT_147588 [Penicilliopsis zonata CBS 506.65]|uniref:Uncharacterized protein n=1 Tax=Penicilliopsis zonata CBS 506.65 TaxID=1073090 RepID=A0A1L9S549_9EURO|nr:hypothetical protein ASPZODRAFT_147588 [Penicilliopsis zonata CBS 506.65]OJJ42283.1 hypothetical protein ASPZODRAFT_147588 [Penicilliopsis zonata CBS 506.65]
MTVLNPDSTTANAVMDEMLHYRSPDGVIMTFFSPFKNRVDPVVCCNVLSLFYKHGRGHELAETLTWVRDVVIHRAYIPAIVRSLAEVDLQRYKPQSPCSYLQVYQGVFIQGHALLTLFEHLHAQPWHRKNCPSCKHKTADIAPAALPDTPVARLESVNPNPKPGQGQSHPPNHQRQNLDAGLCRKKTP